MINARYFIDGQLVDMWFDTPVGAISTLANIYLETTNKDPEYIFMSYELYADMLKEAQTVSAYVNSIPKFMTATGIIEIKLVRDPKGRFIYVGDEQGYKNCLIDKEFEKIFFGVEDAD
jgi:hypothetical protein